MAKRMADYPDSFGAHKGTVFGHSGPSSYTRVTVGPLAGGDTVTAAEGGIKFFDIVCPTGLADSGQFYVRGVPPVGNPSTNVQAAHAASWKLQWISNVTATVGGQSQTAGTEAASGTDLSTQTIRLFALGRY